MSCLSTNTVNTTTAVCEWLRGRGVGLYCMMGLMAQRTEEKNYHFFPPATYQVINRCEKLITVLERIRDATYSLPPSRSLEYSDQHGLLDSISKKSFRLISHSHRYYRRLTKRVASGTKVIDTGLWPLPQLDSRNIQKSPGTIFSWAMATLTAVANSEHTPKKTGK